MKKKVASISSNLKKLDSMSERDIDYSDSPPTDKKFWANAKIYVASKQAVSLRVDEDVLAFFKASGKGYQTVMNKVLRQYMETHSSKR